MLEQFVRNLSRLGVERIRTEVGWTEALAVFLGLHGFDLAPRLVLERSLAADAGNEPAASRSFSATPRSE
jgi:hypothetical protein